MKVLLIILAVLVAFIAVTLVRAVFYKSEKPVVEKFDDELVHSERAQENLSKAIQIKTVSNSDESKTDWGEFDRFHQFLKESFPLIHENLELEKVSKASLMFYWKGTDESLDPIAFLAHQDVVPVAPGTEDDWTHPAFEGFNDGEFIWGRGALDMKNHLICLMESVETLLEEGYQPTRGVYICLGHNEEVVAGHDNGAHDMAVALEKKGVHIDSIVDEGGAMLTAKVKGIIDANLTGIGVAEKGYADFKVTVRGKGGHSSQPPKHTAIGKLSKKVENLENHQFKGKIMPFIYNLFTDIGKHTSYLGRVVFCNLWLLKPLLLKVMTKIPPAASLVRTTTAVTMSSGSPAANVLPEKASVTINFRIMPGESIEDVRRHIEKYMGGDDVEIEFLKGKEPSLISPTETRAFDTLRRLSVSLDEKNIVAPYLVMGGTDAYNYENVCSNIYRFAPFTVDTQLLLTTHSTNERIPVDQLTQGITFFKRYIRIMTGE
ncbi:MAG: M20/M25/M40 family metallo-hydrolase [Eubacteriales bacterium]|nr:M20/M25/M40 family metallo-hydrolase [Eubacteriales bacterium]